MLSQEPSLTVAAPKEEKPAPGGASTRIRVIEPGTVSLLHLVKELWRSRELLYFLAWRDLKVRYKQTALGVLWAILQPVISMVVSSICFGPVATIAKFPAGLPFPCFPYSGLVPWSFFASRLRRWKNSVVGNGSLITKVRFPRVALPIT